MAALDLHERNDQRGGDGEARQRPRRGPTPAVGLDQGEDEGDRAKRDRDGAFDVVAAPRDPLGAALRHDPRSQRQHDGADRHVDEEDPAPAQRLDDHPAEEQPDGATGARDGAPDGERAVSVRPFGEGGEDDREGRRRDHRAAEPLQAPGDQQHPLGLREPTEQRSAGEDGDPGHEQPAASEPVGGAPAEQQEAAEDQGVGVQHPGEALFGEADVDLDRRQRDVDDGRVQHDHELRHRDERQHGVRVDAGGRAGD